MKTLREAVREVIEQRIIPWIERDGISKLLLPEQITPDHCAKPMKCRQPCDLRHKEHELAIGLKGKPTYCIEDKAVIIPPRRMVLVPAGTPHTSTQATMRFTANPDTKLPSSILWFTAYQFGVRMQVSYMSDDADVSEAAWPHVFLGRHFSTLMDRLLEEARSRHSGYTRIARYIILEFIERYLRATADADADTLTVPTCRRTPEPDSKQLPSRVQAAREFIYSNYHTSISLDDIAGAAECSVTYLNQQFKDATGRTPIQYLLAVRMEAARELLLTDLKISEVAFIVGIKDPAYFSRVFGQINGVSPVQYRRKMVEKASPRPASAKSRSSGRSQP